MGMRFSLHPVRMAFRTLRVVVPLCAVTLALADGQEKVATTHKDCKWDWKMMRCSPTEQCKYQPKLGDIYPGMSCRLRPSNSSEPAGPVTSTAAPAVDIDKVN